MPNKKKEKKRKVPTFVLKDNRREKSNRQTQFNSKSPVLHIITPLPHTNLKKTQLTPETPRMHRLLLESHGGGNETSGGGGDGYMRDMNFDANMVIILAALLCALILALGLNSILRCAMRCGFGLSSSAAAGAVADRSGLKKRELKKFPVAAYGSGEVKIAATECAICLGEFADGERVRVLPPCNHSFHMSCIDTWLVSHSSCPNCRHSLIEVHVVGSE